MDHYLDIHLRPDPEFPMHQLMATLFIKLHRVLAEVQTTTIGVSFPGYSLAPIALGNTLRLIGPETDLRRLMERPWLMGMRDHTLLNAIAPVPANAEHRGLRRVQVKSNPERLVRRQMRRHDFTEAQARSKYDSMKAQSLPLPFIALTSNTTGQSFKLFLKLGSAEAHSRVAGFNAYGLSQTATVPWF